MVEGRRESLCPRVDCPLRAGRTRVPHQNKQLEVGKIVLSGIWWWKNQNFSLGAARSGFRSGFKHVLAPLGAFEALLALVRVLQFRQPPVASRIFVAADMHPTTPKKTLRRAPLYGRTHFSPQVFSPAVVVLMAHLSSTAVTGGRQFRTGGCMSQHCFATAQMIPSITPEQFR